MFSKKFLAGAAAIGFATAVPTTDTSTLSSIWVTEVPTYVRPYAIAHYMAGGCVIGAQVYRFPVTGPSSDYAFSLISTNAPGSTSLGVLPHAHEVHYENFFSFRGHFQLWTDKYDDENTRVLGPGDYGAVPENTTHTFQLLDLDTEMIGVIQPGGFECASPLLPPSFRIDH
jgi:mannose-6-phosphate isomerase-like protein (cupin superfamily)